MPNAYIPSHVKTDSGLLIAEKSTDYFQYYFNTNKPSSCPIDKPKKPISKPEKVKNLFQSNYMWSLATVVIAAIFPLAKIIYDCKKRSKAESEKYSDPGSLLNSSKGSKKVSNSRSSEKITDNTNNTGSIHLSFSSPELVDGMIKIGKILYDPKTVLGHGCEGTFVYK